MRVKPFRVFNGEVRNKASRVFDGEASGICDWEDIKYPIMLELNKQMASNFWVEDEIRLNEDIKQYRNVLNERERYVYNISTGALTSLDSIATRFNFVMGYTITDPSVASNILLVGYYENLHTRSYQFLTSTMLNSEEKKQTFNAPKTIPLLIERNGLVFKWIQEFINDPSDMNKLYRGLLANLVLEGIYFTGGFAYFHSLARTNRMIGSNNMINLIKEDETHHSVLYGEIMKILMHENPEMNTEENMNIALDFIRTCVEKEKEWAEFLFEGIDTLSIPEYKDYIEYLANVVCRNAGIQEVYPENKELKSKWVLKYGRKKGGTKSDFFQTNVIDYSHESGEGFDL